MLFNLLEILLKKNNMEKLSNSNLQFEPFDVESLGEPESVKPGCSIFDYKILSSKEIPCQRGWFLDSFTLLYVDAKYEQSFFRITHPDLLFVTFSPLLRTALKYCSSYSPKHSENFFNNRRLLDFYSIFKLLHHNRILL